MICQRCLHRASALRAPYSLFRSLTSSTLSPSSNLQPATVSTTATPIRTAESTKPKSVSLGTVLRPKPKVALPQSIAPAGSFLRGLNYLKGRDDPIALPEEEYPEWLWRCLETSAKKGQDGEEAEGDEFSKSKKMRRLAAKRERKLQERLIASGNADALAPKIPLQQQTIDLPGNEEGSVDGALYAMERREEVTKAMRGERRAKIKERNFLGGMR